MRYALAVLILVAGSQSAEFDYSQPAYMPRALASESPCAVIRESHDFHIIPSDNFGKAVALDGDTFVASESSQVYAFIHDDAGTPLDVSDDSWLQGPGPPRNFTTLDLSGDVLIGGYGFGGCILVEKCTGFADVYRRNRNGTAGNPSDDVWTLEASLSVTPVSHGNSFGQDASISGDFAVIPWYESGSVPHTLGANIYRYDGVTWSILQSLTVSAPDVQMAQEAAIDGSWILARGGIDPGSSSEQPYTYVFRLDDAGTPADNSDDQWIEHQQLIPANGDEFVRRLAISGDHAVLVGDEGVYVFGRDDGGTPTDLADDVWIEEAQLESCDAGNASFAVSIDGGLLALGNGYDDLVAADAGAFFLFRHDDGGTAGDPSDDTWNEIGRCVASDGEADDQLGWNISVGDDWIVAGTERRDLPGFTGVGVTYLFNASSTPVPCTDCNNNGRPDTCDVNDGTSANCNNDLIPDECQPDCNANGIADSCDVESGASDDCTGNMIPDECEPDCNATGTADSCDIADGLSVDCNNNGVPDFCDVGTLASPDCNQDGVPDECQPDCDGDGLPDDCEIQSGLATDADLDGRPDECCFADEPPGDGCNEISRIYFSQGFLDRSSGASGGIISGDLYGSSFDSLSLSVSLDLRLDLLGQKIYWSSQTLRRFNFDGSDEEEFTSLAREFDLDLANRKVYWIPDAGASTIGRTDFDGSNEEVILTNADGLVRPVCIAVDPLSQKLFWWDAYTREIYRANLDRTGIETIYEDITAFDLAVDLCNENLYWTSSNSISRGSTEGGSVTSWEAPAYNGRISIDNYGEKIYWTDRSETGVARRANLDGSLIEELPLNIWKNAPFAIAVHAEAYTDCNATGADDICDIARGASADMNANNVPDECEISNEWGDISKNRYLSLTPSDAGTVAYEVSLPDGRIGWIGQPETVNWANLDTSSVSLVVDAPVFRRWTEPIVHVTGCVIAPDQVYEFRSTTDGVLYSSPFTLTTTARPVNGSWADIVGGFDLASQEWTGPNGFVNFQDINAAIKKFQSDPTAPHVTAIDLHPQWPNFTVNFSDIDMVIKGFQGVAYPVPVTDCQTIANCPLGTPSQCLE